MNGIANAIEQNSAAAVSIEPIAAMPDAHRIELHAPRAYAVSERSWLAADPQSALRVHALGFCATGFPPAAPAASTAAAKRATQRFPVLTRDLST
ncbi:hypothetical protein [Gordonia otitidis]|uniref:Uncharacterized protein n=1 Tax=Gordonia otitidis (strain DSM 44809 / CCUG 52243 / JCM 12355 / NBRC 100426 / IFM 10032) TaxID=1108044 RepID=H5TT39_GORO1|nr:hypothetical protein [Gordonia otitidis]UEA58267.1 hypothetical protein LK459_16985 [Gordonia otitidis]GAB36647.1 hypothetical protein GOOTI_232_00040 [Gordonia otitidis NBRC 100426]